ncbi:MAG: hypothetical protein NT090_03460 [Acidobacteria bacterium]|nr:hypothetical protein [Acidobacteriota bacterium]
MKSGELKRWLEKRGCSFHPTQSGHLKVFLRSRVSILPMHGAGKDLRLVSLPLLSEAKVRLYCSMRSAKVCKAELARRLGCHMPQIDRLLDLNHTSRIGQVEAAFRALDKQIVIDIRDRAA